MYIHLAVGAQNSRWAAELRVLEEREVPRHAAEYVPCMSRCSFQRVMRILKFGALILESRVP